MKQLTSMFKPRIVLLATALTVAGVMGAQTTGTTTDSAAGASTPAACAGKEGTALSDCLKLNAPANNNAGATAKMQASDSS